MGGKRESGSCPLFKRTPRMSDGEKKARRLKANPDLKPHNNEYKPNPKSQAERPNRRKKKVSLEKDEGKIENDKVKDENRSEPSIEEPEDKSEYIQFLENNEDDFAKFLENRAEFAQYLMIKDEFAKFQEHKDELTNFLKHQQCLEDFLGDSLTLSEEKAPNGAFILNHPMVQMG